MTYKVEQLAREFYTLPGDTLPEKRKYLNHYIKKIKTVSEEDDLNLLLEAIVPENLLQSKFKVEILLQLKRNDQLLEILKGSNTLLSAKIYKKWKFFVDVFSNMDCDKFFDTIDPHISHSCRMKILKRLSRVLMDEKLSERYFDALKLRYGIKVAAVILPACSIDHIKNTVGSCKMILTSKELLIFAKKNKNFLKFYFSVLPTFNIRFKFEQRYKTIVQYIGRTDADLFWDLYKVYNFNNPNIDINLGESVFSFLFADDEMKTCDREICVAMFKSRKVYNVLSKRGKMHILLASLCHGDENEFFRIYFENKGREFYLIHNFLEHMPKCNYFKYLKDAFRLKFGKDLLEYSQHFSEEFLKVIPKTERETLLDVRAKDHNNLLYLYNTHKSIPLIKEHLEKDVNNPNLYLMQLYETCKFHKDENGLVDVLVYITDKYRHREHLINDIWMNVVQWPNSEKLDSQVWDLIDEMIKIMEYSDETFFSSEFDNYLDKHVMHFVDNCRPIDKFFKSMLNRKTQEIFNFGSTSNAKCYYKKACELMTCMRKKNKFHHDLNNLLKFIASFNDINQENQVSLTDYGHLLEMIAKYEKDFGNKLIIFGAKNNIHESFHNLYRRRSEYIRDKRKHLYIQSQPVISLNTFFDLCTISSLNEEYFENFTCEIKKKLSNYCIEILNLKDDDVKKICSALMLLYYVNSTLFLDVVTELNITKLHQIDGENIIKRTLSICLLRTSNITEFLPLALKIYEESKFKQFLAPIYSYLHRMPLIQVKDILEGLSDSSVIRLRRLSVVFTSIVLHRSDLFKLIKKMNKKESNFSVKRILYKNAFYLFLDDQNDMNWSLLQENIDLAGGDSRTILEFWSKLSLLSPEYCEKYVNLTFNAISKVNGEEKWAKKLLMCLKPPVHDYLDVAFLENLLQEIPFHTTRSRSFYSIVPKDNYYLEFVFYTSGKKQDHLLDFVFKKLEGYVNENWSDFPSAKVFSNVYDFMKAFCKYSFKLKPKNDIVKKFYTKWTSLFPAYIHSNFLMLDFLDLFFDSQCELEEFCKKSNQLLYTYVERFGKSILQIFCHELDYFRDAAKINRFDFLFGFLFSNANDPLTACAVIEMLPMIASIPYADEPKLEKLKAILRNCDNPTVKIYLSQSLDDVSRYY